MKYLKITGKIIITIVVIIAVIWFIDILANAIDSAVEKNERIKCYELQEKGLLNEENYRRWIRED